MVRTLDSNSDSHKKVVETEFIEFLRSKNLIFNAKYLDTWILKRHFQAEKIKENNFGLINEKEGFNEKTNLIFRDIDKAQELIIKIVIHLSVQHTRLLIDEQIYSIMNMISKLELIKDRLFKILSQALSISDASNLEIEIKEVMNELNETKLLMKNNSFYANKIFVQSVIESYSKELKMFEISGSVWIDQSNKDINNKRASFSVPKKIIYAFIVLIIVAIGMTLNTKQIFKRVKTALGINKYIQNVMNSYQDDVVKFNRNWRKTLELDYLQSFGDKLDFNDGMMLELDISNNEAIHFIESLSWRLPFISQLSISVSEPNEMLILEKLLPYLPVKIAKLKLIGLSGLNKHNIKQFISQVPGIFQKAKQIISFEHFYLNNRDLVTILNNSFHVKELELIYMKYSFNEVLKIPDNNYALEKIMIYTKEVKNEEPKWLTSLNNAIWSNKLAKNKIKLSACVPSFPEISLLSKWS